MTLGAHAMRPGNRLVVVSPHHDDAVLSIGATLAHLSHAGVDVRVLTVFGGDPSQDREPGASNVRAGFASTGEAARVRRREDDLACARLAVRPVRLAFDDDEASERNGAAVCAALAPELQGADVVLAPGHPLTHPDHVLVSRATAGALRPTALLGYYLEQPYATWEALSRARATGALRASAAAVQPPRWSRSGACWRCQRHKLLAAGEYRSQLAILRRWPRLRIAAHELVNRGERIAWPAPGPFV